MSEAEKGPASTTAGGVSNTAQAAAAMSSKSSRLAVPLLGLMSGIQICDPNISSVALVKASTDLSFSASTTALASGIMTLALAASVIATGLMGDRLGRRRVLLAALVLSAIGDILVAVSPGSLLYLIGRVLAGVGLGAVFGCSFAYLRVVASDRLGSAMGTFCGLGAATAFVAGLAGGALADSSWRAAYFVVPVLCFLSLPLCRAIIPFEKPSKGDRIDYPGLLLIAVGITGLLYGLSNAAASLTEPKTWAPIAGGLMAIVLFAVVENRSKHAVFPIGLFRKPLFIAAVLSGVGWNLAQGSSGLQLSNLWQYVYKFSTFEVIVAQLPMLLVAIAGAFLVGRQLKHGTSSRTLMVSGFISLFAAFVWLGLIPENSSYWIFVPPLLLLGAGLPLCSTTQAHAYMVQAPASSFGPVTSSRLTVGQFGFSLGMAGTAVLMSQLNSIGITHKLIAAGVPASQTGQGLDAVTLYIRTGDYPSFEVGKQALQDAGSVYVQSFGGTMMVVAGIMVTIGLTCWFLMRSKSSDQHSEATN